MDDLPVEPTVDLPLPFQRIVEHLPVVVYVDSDDLPVPRTLYVSPNVEQILGYPPSAYLAMRDDWLKIVHPDDVDAVAASLAEGSALGEPFQMEYRYVHPDGHVVWVRDRATPHVDPATGARVWQGVIEDITVRIEAERDRNDSDVRYETLLQNLPAVVYEMDPDDDRRTRYVNPKIEGLLGYTMQEWLEQPDMWTEVLHPDDRERELAAHDLHSETGDPWQRDYRLIGSDGQVVWVHDQATLVRDDHDAPLQWQGVMIDITAQKEAGADLVRAHDELEFRVRARTAALQETNELMGIEIGERRRAEVERQRVEAQLGHLLDHVPAVIYLWQMRPSDDGQFFSFVGPQIAEMLGYTPSEWEDGGWRQRVHPHDRQRVAAAAQRSIELGEPFQMEYRYLAKDGRVVWVVDNAVLQRRNDRGEPLLFEGAMIDVTSQREAESRALSADSQLRAIIDQGPVVLYAFRVASWDPPTLAMEYLSPQLSSMLGLPTDRVIEDPMRWFEMVHPDDRASVEMRSRRDWQTGAEWAGEYRVIAADGRVVWLADRGRCVERDEQGRPLRFLGAVADITQRREHLTEVEAALRELRAIAEVMPAMAWTEIIDRRTGVSRFTYVSPAATEIIGLTPEQLIAEAMHFPRLVHPDDRERVQAGSVAASATGVWEDTYRIVRPDGSVRWLHGRGRRASDPDTDLDVWHGVTIDVTAQVEAARAAGLDALDAWAAPPQT